MSFGWKPYVSVAKRRAKAARKMGQLAKKGLKIEPVEITGRKIARTFWGEAWCSHMEQLSDFANRLPRGRTYARNGSVCHLGISEGRIDAIVSGSELYNITIKIKPLPQSKWQKLRNQCSGQIGSILELLQGKFSNQVMEIVTHPDHGLFPNPREIETNCSCPDWADLCKHLAAVFYGVGARLDHQPELLFKLRGVDHQELIDGDLDLNTKGSGKHRHLDGDDLSGLFGVEIDDDGEPQAPKRRPTAKKAASAKTTKPRKVSPAQKRNKPFTPTSKSIARLRNSFGMNKSQFAILVGVSQPTITNWENKNGQLKLQQRHLTELKRLAGMSPDEISKQRA